MLPSLRRLHLALGLLAALGGAVSCGRELTGIHGGRLGRVQLAPSFPSVRLDGREEPLSVGSIVTFNRVRLVLLRTNGDTVLNQVVDFPPDSESITINVTVTLDAAAPASGELLRANLGFVNAAGDTVFRGGPTIVTAAPVNIPRPTPPEIPLNYTGVGADAAAVTITPKQSAVPNGGSITFTAVARSAQGTVIANTPIAFTSLDTTRVKVGLSTGVATVVGYRGSARVVAQTLTGQRDTALVAIPVTPTAITLVSGNNQQVRQAALFPAPLRVRVTAGDGLAAAGAVVTFAVTAGQGTVSQTADTTDADGIAEVLWTAGDVAGPGTVVATVVGATNLSTTFTGTQLSSGPTSLVWASQPAGIVAGDTLPTLKLVVLDATQDTVRAFTGPVTLALSGGTAGAALLGSATVNAVAGIARFPGLTVNRAGTGYRLTATLAAPFAAVPAAASATFAVTPAPASELQLLSGGGQTTLGGTPFADSIRVRVRDRFGFDVVGAPVTFTVAGGGGSVAPTTATTNASGQAATRWTAGLVGTQLVDVTVPGVAPLRVVSFTPSGLLLTSGNGQVARVGELFGQPIVFTVRTDSGTTVAGVPVAFAVTGGGTLSQARDTTDAEGMVSVRWTAGLTVGGATLTATIVGTDRTATAEANQASAGPTTVNFLSQPSSLAAAGDTLPTLRVIVLDGIADTVNAFTGTVRLTLTGGTAGAQLLGTASVRAVNGIATFPGLTVDRAGTGYRLDAVLDSLPTVRGTSAPFDAGPAPAVRFQLTGPTSAQAGDTVLVRVTAFDRFGFIAAGVSGPRTLRLLAAEPTAVGAVVVGGVVTPFGTEAAIPFSAGVAEVRVVLERTGATTLLASEASTGVGTPSGDQLVIAIAPAVAAALVVDVQPRGAVNGEALSTPPVVAVVDRFGNRTGAAGVTVSASVASGGALLGGTPLRLTTSPGGTVTFTDLGLMGVGLQTLRFSAPSLASALSDTVRIVPATGGIRLHVTPSSATSAKVGATVALPVYLDLSNRGPDDLASITTTIAWDTTAFAYVGDSAGTWIDASGGSPSTFVNTTATAAGRLTLSAFTADATTSTVLIRTLYLLPRVAGTSAVTATVSVAGAVAGTSVTVTPRGVVLTTSP